MPVLRLSDRVPIGKPFISAVAAWVLLLGADAAVAVTLRVLTEGLRSDAGEVLVALCRKDEFLGRSCAWNARAAAGAEIVLEGVPPGRYALQAIHDENADGDLNRTGLLPDEGLAFSRDAPMRFGPPRFEDAAFDLTEQGGIPPFDRIFCIPLFVRRKTGQSCVRKGRCAALDPPDAAGRVGSA